MRKILIVGANFENKGAQSMLFVTISEIRKRNPESEIYFATTGSIEENLYSFKRVFYSYDAKQIALGNKAVQTRCKRFVKDLIKTNTGRRTNVWQYKQLEQLIPEIDLIIDISGFALGKKFTVGTQENFLDNIRLARKYGIPIILMPQSFGPFDYQEDRDYLLEEIKNEFTYPSVIFAREKEGYDALTRQFGLSNVRLSSDLVLQSRDINLDFIYKQSIQMDIPNIHETNVVGVVPNKQCFHRVNSEDLLTLYYMIIEKLLASDKEVYIFRHSGEDLEPCQEIYAMFDENPHVHLLPDDFSCLEYNEVVKQFQFMICSRYHGIVHAYRNGVPCVILGWAVKYSEVADLVGQGQYEFNIVDNEINEKKILNAVENMIGSVETESMEIKERVKEIQEDNCFDVLDEFL